MSKVALYLLSNLVMRKLFVNGKQLASFFTLIAQKHEIKLFKFCSKKRGSTSCQNGEVAFVFNVRYNSSSSPKKKNPSGGIINPLFTRFVRQRRLEISFIHQIGNYYCYMYCKTIKNKYRIKEIQTYIRACNVEFTKGFSYYRI